MKIKAGALVTELSGSLAGSTVQRSRSGMVMHARIAPIQPASRSQLSQRVRIHRVSQRWRELTQAQRNNWNAIAPRFLDSGGNASDRKLSGFECFKMVNSRLLQQAVPMVSTPPVPTPGPSFRLTGVTADQSSQILTVSLTGTPVGLYFAIAEATPPLSAGVTNPNNKFVFIRGTNATNPVSFAIGPEYRAKFGDLRTGQKIFIRITIRHRTSTLSQGPLQILATVVN